MVEREKNRELSDMNKYIKRNRFTALHDDYITLGDGAGKCWEKDTDKEKGINFKLCFHIVSIW